MTSQLQIQVVPRKMYVFALSLALGAFFIFGGDRDEASHQRTGSNFLNPLHLSYKESKHYGKRTAEDL